MYKEFCSIAIQTDDFGCGNGCTSVYIDMESYNVHSMCETTQLDPYTQVKFGESSDSYIEKASSNLSSNQFEKLSNLDMGSVVGNNIDKFDHMNASNTLMEHTETESEHAFVNVEHRFDYNVITELCDIPTSSGYCEEESNDCSVFNFIDLETMDTARPGTSTALQTQQKTAKVGFDVQCYVNNKNFQERELAIQNLSGKGQKYVENESEEAFRLIPQGVSGSVQIEPNLFSEREGDFNNTQDEEEPDRNTDVFPLMPNGLEESDIRNSCSSSQRNGRYSLNDVYGSEEWQLFEEKHVSNYTGRSLMLSELIRREINSDSVKQGTSLTCSHCAKQFKRKSHLTRHVRVHTGEKPFACQQCPKKFSEKNAFNYHLKIHNNEKPFQCSHCEMKFRDKKTLNNHLKIHTGDDLFECSQCSKTYTTKSHLQRHFKVHTGERPFECSDCERRFSDKHELKRHQVVHSGEKRFECSYCGKKFARKKYISDHERIHSGEKPFSCPHCEKCFTQRNGLRKHIRLHTGEKPHKCTHCEKKFAQKSVLNSHLRTHSGEKPYKCNHCEKNFAEKGNLRRHLVIHTGEKS